MLDEIKKEILEERIQKRIKQQNNILYGIIDGLKWLRDNGNSKKGIMECVSDLYDYLEKIDDLAEEEFNNGKK